MALRQREADSTRSDCYFVLAFCRPLDAQSKLEVGDRVIELSYILFGTIIVGYSEVRGDGRTRLVVAQSRCNIVPPIALMTLKVRPLVRALTGDVNEKY